MSAGSYVGPCFLCRRALHYSGAGRKPLTCGRRECQNALRLFNRRNGAKRMPWCVCAWCGHRHRDTVSDETKHRPIRAQIGRPRTHASAARVGPIEFGFKGPLGESTEGEG